MTAIEFLEGHSLYAVLDGHGKKGHIHSIALRLVQH